jgi:predicted  nucleic acid-binding Zn-ribbon protein
MTSELEGLLDVQAHDLALDRLRHRREAMPERAELTARRNDLAARDRDAAGVQQQRDEVHREERRLDDEAQAVGDRATEVEQKLYSGSVTSPRELQAMQADLEMLRRHRSELEDHELEIMEQREALDTQLATLDTVRASLQADIERLEGVIAATERDIDAEIAVEEAARATSAGPLSAALLADYEKRRVRNKGAGAARLVGTTCGACHLSIPSTEAEQIHRGGGTGVAYCDNCGAILVP